MNHAVVNEDPNARIIRELRAEVDALKDMLKHASVSEFVRSKCVMGRVGNRSVRVSDFSLQKFRFSAPCGPN